MADDEENRCLLLAEHFLKREGWYTAKSLSDRDLYLWELAATIQETIDSEIQHYREGK